MFIQKGRPLLGMGLQVVGALSQIVFKFGSIDKVNV